MNGNDTSKPLPIPLPTEIPPPPDLSRLPSHILHSGTVETLIGQNEDLFARLKVNIRRNSILEQQIIENERVNTDLTRVNNTVIAQLQVLQEKDRVWREKSSSVDSRHDALKEEIEFLKIRLESAEDRNEELSAGLGHETSYRRRIRAWVRPLLDSLKSKLVAARLHIQELDREANHKDAIISDLRERVSEAVHQMQSQERIFSRDQSQLIEQYENQIGDLKSEIAKIRTESSLLRDKALRLDEAVAQRTELENRIIYLERQLQEMEKGHDTAITEAEEQIAKYRQEAKVLAVETLDYDRKLNESAKQLTGLQEEHSRLQDQFESLQTLWSDAQKKAEASKLQHESLNRLNQELSRQLKEQRKALETATLNTARVTQVAVPLKEPQFHADPIEDFETNDHSPSPSV
jgi:chromosome segregation ATPase